MPPVEERNVPPICLHNAYSGFQHLSPLPTEKVSHVFLSFGLPSDDSEVGSGVQEVPTDTNTASNFSDTLDEWLAS